jgi:DNA replication protein DnaC
LRHLPERIDLYDVIPERFHYAKLEDLPAPLVRKYEERPEDKGLLLWGPPGRGKTHAMSAFLFDLHLNGHKVARIEYEMLCLRIRDTFKPGSADTELSVIRPYINAEVLCIEDLGTTVSTGAQESDFSLRTFLVLLDQRLEWCRPTFITTNKSVEELGKSFDPRVASRLCQACEVVQLTGRDRRKGQA